MARPRGSFLPVGFLEGRLGPHCCRGSGTDLCVALDTSPPTVGSFPVCRMRDVVEQVLLGAPPGPHHLILRLK